MKGRISTLKASAAVAALTCAFIAPPALAFDELNWTWNKTIDETVTKNININADINPTGMTEVEKLQIQIGDVNASSIVTGITNNPPADGDGGTFTFSETFVVDTFEDEDSPGADIPGAPGVGDDPTNGVEAALLEGEIIEIDDGDDEIILLFEVNGEVALVPSDALDATTELPKVESVATAVGNNQNIESAASTQLHDAQILFDVGGQGGSLDGIPSEVSGLVAQAGNLHTQVGLATALGAAVGVIDKAEITATSEVSDILNARVDSSATAVGNNMSVDMSEAPVGDQVLIADITQVSVADITATSSVSGVTLNNYSNLGAEGVNPIVSSVATAIGNNLSINVGVPGDE